MRTPRASFVVEYKTSRRQGKNRPSSIWGNLDLQAVARAVEAENTELAQASRRSLAASEETSASQPQEVGVQYQARTENPLASPTAMSLASEGKPGVAQGSAQGVEASSQKQLASTPGWAPGSGSKPRAGRGHSVIEERLAAPYHRNPPWQYVSVEELAALEAENRYLKRLMVIKLREDNERLKSMFRRFEAARS